MNVIFKNGQFKIAFLKISTPKMVFLKLSQYFFREKMISTKTVENIEK